MFSMKYTSPKVTPKKSEPTALSSSALGPSSVDVNVDSAIHSSFSKREEYILPEFNATHSLGQSISNGTENSPDAEDLMNTNKLTKDNIISNNRDYSSSSVALSENDSAVANVSSVGVETPRSNLLSLLDREYANGSNSGEALNNTKDSVQHIDEEVDTATAHDATGDAVINQETASKDCIQEENNSFDGDDMGHVDLQSIEPSSANFPQKEDALDKANNGACDFHRSVSMEPMFDKITSEEVDSSTHTISVDKESAGVAEQSGNITHQSNEEVSKNAPIVYDMTQQPASPIMSEINGGGNVTESTVPMLNSPTSGVTLSEIGGDTYFDKQPAPDTPDVDEKKAGHDSVDDSDLVHVTLPPRVNRTTMNGYPNDNTTPFLPSCPSTPTRAMSQSASTNPISPRLQFAHTHSLLDDSSDDEEDMASFTIVDSPTRHVNSYSCIPRPRASSEGRNSPFSYFKKQKHSGKNGRHRTSYSAGTTATRVASNNIQQALLQTRHRRWDCQSIFAGSHAQSKEVFDISNRVHYPVGYNISEDGGNEVRVARLSVSVEAVRAAALASGLWRTVRLVKLPKGLFWSHGDEFIEDNEVWTLLKMLNSTFPVLEQIDCGGDISRTTEMSDDDVTNVSINDWRDEILSCIMECLPNIVAIDGYAVEREMQTSDEKLESEYYTDDICSDQSEQNLASFSDEFCGVSSSEIVDVASQNGQTLTTDAASTTHIEQNKVHVADDRITGPNEGSENSELSPCSSPTTDSVDNEMKKVPALSSSSSSRSWGSSGSGTRPPTCPTSASQQRPRLPTKPSADRKKSSKGSFMKAGSGLKRRVLGLIPTVSMMDDEEEEEDDDEEDDDSEDSGGNAVGSDCPADLL